jgi:outer membrane protein assembly factor BamB
MQKINGFRWIFCNVWIVFALMLILSCKESRNISSEEEWLQFKYDSRHSGNAPDKDITVPLELIGTVPLTDAVFTAPVVSEGYVYVVDGSGVVFCIDANDLDIVWQYNTGEGKVNYNNISSPAIAGNYLHVGTKSGFYYVFDKKDGKLVNKISCGDPVFNAPVVANDRVYFATLGSRIYALKPNGKVYWEWDYLKERLNFDGNRWSGEDWKRHVEKRSGERGDTKTFPSVTPGDQFFCSSNMAIYDNILVIPTGGVVTWLEDAGDSARYRGERVAMGFGPGERRGRGYDKPSTFSLSIGENGKVYRQWHYLDNTGQVDILQLKGDSTEVGYVEGTQTNARCFDRIGFSSVSVRGEDVFRCRPQENFGLCKHLPDGKVVPLGNYPSVSSPVILQNHVVYGGLDGKLYVVSLSDSSEVWSFETAFGKAITAPVAVSGGRIYFGCDDGYLYVLGPEGKASLPSRELELWKIRNPLTGKYTDSKYDWFTSFGNFANTNVATNDQDIRPPFKINWINKFKGTVKHFSTCGGGRLYTHTAEGQIFAVEQETGRLLWRQYFPGVDVSYTCPLYYDGRVIVPQAGFEKCRLRCFDAENGKLIWEVPFSGSPSWNRQQPPVVYKNLVIYQFSTGDRASDESELGEKPVWLMEHQNVPNFPEGHEPLLVAWDLDTGREVWRRNFSEFGTGGDEAGLCLMNGTLYYSCYFGHSPAKRRGIPGPMGITAAIDPLTGKDIWHTTKYYIHGGCTISGKDERLYLGGYNPVVSHAPDFDSQRGIMTTTKDGGRRLYTKVWCIDALNNSLVWESDPLLTSIHVVTVGEEFLFTHSQYQHGYLLNKSTGEILTDHVSEGYKCTRFIFAGAYMIAANMDIFDLSETDDIELVNSGPRSEPSECAGGIVSNGRIFYTTVGSGIQIGGLYGTEAESFQSPWEN